MPCRQENHQMPDPIPAMHAVTAIMPRVLEALDAAPGGIMHHDQLSRLVEECARPLCRSDTKSSTFRIEVKIRALSKYRVLTGESFRPPLAFVQVGPQLYANARGAPDHPPGADPAAFVATYPGFNRRCPAHLIEEAKAGRSPDFRPVLAAWAAEEGRPGAAPRPYRPDPRTFVPRQIVEASLSGRPGQEAFAARVRDAFGGKCAASGWMAGTQAAHIVSYPGADDNALENGLLLRADLHIAFDAGLLRFVAVDDDHLVEIAPGVECPGLLALDMTEVRLPAWFRGLDIQAERRGPALQAAA
jgi:hypothetical protein